MFSAKISKIFPLAPSALANPRLTFGRDAWQKVLFPSKCFFRFGSHVFFMQFLVQARTFFQVNDVKRQKIFCSHLRRSQVLSSLS